MEDAMIEKKKIRTHDEMSWTEIMDENLDLK